MKICFILSVFTFWCATIVFANTRDLLYDGHEIYLHVKKDHVSIVLFPEPITAVIRGFGADRYIIQHHDQKSQRLEIMPTTDDVAEMTVSGMSGEAYVMRCISQKDFDMKLVIHRSINLQTKNSDRSITAPMDILPSTLIVKKEAHNDTNTSLPASLNLKITLKGNNLPLKIYLSTIAQVTGYNVITTPSIDAQKTSLNIEHIEVWRALKSLLYKFGYGFKVSAEDLIITETETRIFNISMPAVEQSFEDQTSNESFANTANSSSTTTNNQQNQEIKVGTKIFYENTSPKLSLWADLENNVKALITPRLGNYSINKLSGSIIVTDKPAVLDKIGDLVSTINDSLSRQQSFEIQIIEVTLSSDHEMGIDWNAIAKNLKGLNNITAGTNFSTAGFLSGQLLTLSATAPNQGSGTTRGGVGLMLKALDSMGDVNVISRPSITVSNMFPAIIQEVTSIPFISGTGQTIGNNITQSNVTTSQVSDGLTMRLEAKMDRDKTVLNISAAINTLDAINTIPVGNGLSIQEPQVSTKSITTNVGIEPNKTLILGGLISTSKNIQREGVPYLNKLPWVGNAFGFRAHSVKKTELVILITPKLELHNM